MTRALIAVVVAGSACATSPTAPGNESSATVLAGQSNAIGLRPALEALTPLAGAGDRGATAIACWASTGACWAELKPAIQSARPVDAFVWWQGEMDILQCVVPDVYGACPTGYGQSLTNLIARVRSAAGDPHLTIVVMQMGTWAAHFGRSSTVERETLAWVQQDANAVYVETRDQEYRTDGIHMTEAGYTQVAKRVVEAIRQKRGR